MRTKAEILCMIVTHNQSKFHDVQGVSYDTLKFECVFWLIIVMNCHEVQGVSFDTLKSESVFWLIIFMNCHIEDIVFNI